MENTSEVFALKEVYKDSINTLLSKVNSATSESVIKGYLTELEQLQANYEQSVMETLSPFTVVEQGYMPDLSITSFTEYDGKRTIFEGNTKFGEELNGEWVFKDEYQFLGKLSVVTGTCEMSI